MGLFEKLVRDLGGRTRATRRALEEIDRSSPSSRSGARRSSPSSGTPNAPATRSSSPARSRRRPSHTNDAALHRALLLRAAEVIEGRLGNRDGALRADKALAIEANGAGRAARALPADRQGEPLRGGEESAARADRARDEDNRRFGPWMEIALLDEQRMKKPFNAVKAYAQAAQVKPRHPLPPREIVRLLRGLGEPERLVRTRCIQLAATAADQNEYARLCSRRPRSRSACSATTTRARNASCRRTALGGRPRPRDGRVDEADPHAQVAARGSWRASTRGGSAGASGLNHNLRIALAGGGARRSAIAPNAVRILEGLLGVVPTTSPRCACSEQLHRRHLGPPPRRPLRADRRRLDSSSPRRRALGARRLEEHVGQGAVLDALIRIASEAPGDTAALDGIVRVAGKLTTGVAVPHPAALATRARLVQAIAARKELARDLATRALYQIEESILVESFARDNPDSLQAALAGYREALLSLPDSLLAARGLERLSDKLGDRGSLVLSQRALAKLVADPRARAAHLVRAAAITAEDTKTLPDALALFEEALVTDPDCQPAAQALARMLAGDFGRLTDRLGAALQSATRSEQIVQLGVELARAFLRQPPGFVDANPAIGAMRKVLAVVPTDPTALLLSARLLVAQRVWADARDVLTKVVELAQDGETRLTALFMLADVYDAGLMNPAVRASSSRPCSRSTTGTGAPSSACSSSRWARRTRRSPCKPSRGWPTPRPTRPVGWTRTSNSPTSAAMRGT